MVAPSPEDIVRHIRAYLWYAEMSERALAEAAGLSRVTTAGLLNGSRPWNPRLDTLAKLRSVMPEDFDADAVLREYALAKQVIRRWFANCGLKRYQLAEIGIQYAWVRDIDDDDWCPSWFAVRRILSLIPPHERGAQHGPRPTAEAET